jgi:hypothetical protein
MTPEQIRKDEEEEEHRQLEIALRMSQEQAELEQRMRLQMQSVPMEYQLTHQLADQTATNELLADILQTLENTQDPGVRSKLDAARKKLSTLQVRCTTQAPLANCTRMKL